MILAELEQAKKERRMNGVIREKPRPNFIVGSFTARKHGKTSGNFKLRKYPNTTAKARTSGRSDKWTPRGE